MSARDAASNVSTRFCFRRSASPRTPPLAPRRDQVPEGRIFEAQPPNTDSFQPVLVHQGELAPQGLGALDPELVLDPAGRVAKMHLLLGRIEGRRRAMILGERHRVGV